MDQRVCLRRSIFARLLVVPIAATWAIAAPVPAGSAAKLPQCVADCNRSGDITVDELVIAVGMALGIEPTDRCGSADANADGTVTVDDLVQALLAALNGCEPASGAKPCPRRPGGFTNCLATSGIASGPPRYANSENGAAVADVDGDGLPDLFYYNALDRPVLYRNRGDFQFEEVRNSGIEIEPFRLNFAAFGDMDNDGRTDLVGFLGYDDFAAWLSMETGTHTVVVYRNMGDFHFEDVTEAWGFGVIPMHEEGFTNSASLVDLNMDRRLDVVVSLSTKAIAHYLLYLSQPDGMWKEQSREYLSDHWQGSGFSTLWTDLNDDGWLDCVLINDFDPPSRVFFRVPGAVRFEEAMIGPPFGVAGFSLMGGAAADIDGDGKPEIALTDNGNQHLLSHLVDVAPAAGTTGNPNRSGRRTVGWSPAFVDYDNDARADLFIVAGANGGLPDDVGSYSLLFRNLGNLRFEDTSSLLPDDGIRSERGLAVADFDRDGGVDFFIGGQGAPPRFLRNEVPGGNMLSIALRGRTANAEGIGARVTVLVAGHLPQTREMFPGGVINGYHEPRLVFGMGEASRADTVIVDWRPAAGEGIREYTDLSSGFVTLDENGTASAGARRRD